MQLDGRRTFNKLGIPSVGMTPTERRKHMLYKLSKESGLRRKQMVNYLPEENMASGEHMIKDKNKRKVGMMIKDKTNEK